jgi:hypothetical protein
MGVLCADDEDDDNGACGPDWGAESNDSATTGGCGLEEPPALAPRLDVGADGGGARAGGGCGGP